MNTQTPHVAISDLHATPASSVKKEGWRGLMRILSRKSKVLVTNHNHPEAVILSTDEYERLIQAARDNTSQQRDPLEELRRRFDHRLEALKREDAAERLREVMDQPPQLQGRVKAGPSF